MCGSTGSYFPLMEPAHYIDGENVFSGTELFWTMKMNHTGKMTGKIYGKAHLHCLDYNFVSSGGVELLLSSDAAL